MNLEWSNQPLCEYMFGNICVEIVDVLISFSISTVVSTDTCIFASDCSVALVVLSVCLSVYLCVSVHVCV